MEQLTVGSLFSGIGGLDLGLERAGMRVVWQCESDPYARAVLARHWPGIPCYADARALANPDALGRDGRADDEGQEAPTRNGSALSCDVLCGGFPCQPVSVAGRQLKQRDARWLWPIFAAVIRRVRPRYVLVENVSGLLAGPMGDVLGDLARLGFDAEWQSIPARAVGAPHRRYRVFIVAYAIGDELRDESGRSGRARGQGATEPHNDGAPQSVAGASSARGQAGLPAPGHREEGHAEELVYGSDRRAGWTPRDQWAVEPDVGRVADGIPSRVDRLRTLGNAVVPQVAEWVGRQIVTNHQRVSSAVLTAASTE